MPASLTTAFRLALPPSLGPSEMRGRADRLAAYLTASIGRKTEVKVPDSYDSLAKDLLASRLDAAWAPPFVCARIEAMGVRVLARGVRKGASTYRAALLCRKEANITLERLRGLSAIWVDRDSVGGYLLAMAFLKSKGLDPQKTFFAQQFAGSYKAAVEGMLAGKAEVTSVFAPPASSNADALSGLEDIAPGRRGDVNLIALTDESPNDGVAVSMATSPELLAALEKTFLGMHESAEGAALLREIFNAERFELAPRMGYRALYRVALASV